MFSCTVTSLSLSFMEGVGTKGYTPNLSPNHLRDSRVSLMGLSPRHPPAGVSQACPEAGVGPGLGASLPYLRAAPEVIQGRQAQVWGRGSGSRDAVSDLLTVHLP